MSHLSVYFYIILNSRNMTKNDVETIRKKLSRILSLPKLYKNFIVKKSSKEKLLKSTEFRVYFALLTRNRKQA